ncbi:hypothetical protein BDV3_000596 [Batrachochytrium dendrobatidis]|uniref:Uncharacterized protein n=1 Tax=Batrachochytrium dendrobatidis (strain JEL423) TaxID=403673 RepID=A0A177W781_BATDL|nr:hypothetical protein BDEG_20163 [Batrachochytrium dendrobatidis JEL423]
MPENFTTNTPTTTADLTSMLDHEERINSLEIRMAHITGALAHALDEIHRLKSGQPLIVPQTTMVSSKQPAKKLSKFSKWYQDLLKLNQTVVAFLHFIETPANRLIDLDGTAVKGLIQQLEDRVNSATIKKSDGLLDRKVPLPESSHLEKEFELAIKFAIENQQQLMNRADRNSPGFWITHTHRICQNTLKKWLADRSVWSMLIQDLVAGYFLLFAKIYTILTGPRHRSPKVNRLNSQDLDLDQNDSITDSDSQIGQDHAMVNPTLPLEILQNALSLPMIASTTGIKKRSKSKIRSQSRLKRAAPTVLNNTTTNATTITEVQALQCAQANTQFKPVDAQNSVHFATGLLPLEPNQQQQLLLQPQHQQSQFQSQTNTTTLRKKR